MGAGLFGNYIEIAIFNDSVKTEGLIMLDSAAVCPRQVLLTVLSSDLEDGIETVLIKFANASKLGETASV